MNHYAVYKSTTGRLLAIILRLSQSSHWSPGALAEDLGVSDRTVYRDLNRIRAAGLPIQYDDMRGGYIIDWTCAVPIPQPKMRPKRIPEPKPIREWKDSVEVCGKCGRKFVWTAAKQKNRHANVRSARAPRDAPPYCSRACAAGRKKRKS